MSLTLPFATMLGPNSGAGQDGQIFGSITPLAVTALDGIHNLASQHVALADTDALGNVIYSDVSGKISAFFDGNGQLFLWTATATTWTSRPYRYMVQIY